jgi:outer membrane receptor protein involved in Fe transport
MQVNGFFPAGGNGINATGITSRYNIERVEVIGGPQAPLYGVSGSGGVTNLITKRAQFNRRSSGELRYELNHYGYKQGQLDYSWGSERVAIRVALLDQVLGARRLFIGGPLQAGYLQLALRPLKTTVLRYSLERSNLDRINANSGNMTLTALNTRPNTCSTTTASCFCPIT